MDDHAAPIQVWRNNRRVAVLGMSSSGKTVFLTSLIDRFLRADGTQSKSMFGDTTWIVDRLAPADGIAAFPYEYYREDCLRVQRWPDKTTASSQIRLRRTRQGQGVRGALLRRFGEERTFIDIPGERIADFSLAGRSFAEWSDYMIGALNEARYYPFAEHFLRLEDRDTDEVDESAVLREYKRVLARFTHRSIPLVAPSTFLVDEAGRYPGRDEPPAHKQPIDDLVANRLSGLDSGSEFAPLSPQLRAARPDLDARFAERFNRYRERLADPLGAGFSSCDQLIVLVDVAAILEDGPEVYHATRKTLQLAMEYLDPGTPAGGRLRDLTMRLISGGRWGSSGVREVAVLASKADCVHRLDRSNLPSLLEAMTDEIFKPAIVERGLAVCCFECAAVNATNSDEEYPWLTGCVALEEDSTAFPRRLRFRVSDVPGEWPPESVWREEEFAFADPDPPPLDMLGREPFPGINMDKVAAFVGWPDDSG